MVRLKGPLCEHHGCKKLSSFAFKGKARLFSVQHAQEGMINVTRKLCISDGCVEQVGTIKVSVGLFVVLSRPPAATEACGLYVWVAIAERR